MQTPQLSSGGATSEIYFKCFKGGEMRKEIQAQWKTIYTYLHSLKENIGKQLHHIAGRVGVFLACRLLIVPLTRQQHEEEHKTHRLREINMILIRNIRHFWNKNYGCMNMHKPECLECSLLYAPLKEQIIKDKDVICCITCKKVIIFPLSELHFPIKYFWYINGKKEPICQQCYKEKGGIEQ